MKKVNKTKTEKKLTIKLVLCIVYFIVITILFVCSYKLFIEKYDAKPWGEVESVDEYSYIKVSKMSEMFAYYEEENIGIHFVIEKEETGVWHTYLIAINEDDYDKYKDIIDYTYERTKEEPKAKKVYGYPEIIKADLKNIAIKKSLSMRLFYCITSLIASPIVLFTSAIITLNLTSLSKYSFTFSFLTRIVYNSCNFFIFSSLCCSPCIANNCSSYLIFSNSST